MYLQQNHHSLIWRGDILGQSGPIAVGTNEFGICPRDTTSADQIVSRSGSVTSQGVVSAGGALSGVHTVSFDRLDGTGFQVYVDGAVNGSLVAQTTVAFSSASPIYIGARSGGGSPGVDTVQRVRWVAAGAGLGSADQAALHALMAAADAVQPA